jgi:hypothetical protein
MLRRSVWTSQRPCSKSPERMRHGGSLGGSASRADPVRAIPGESPADARGDGSLRHGALFGAASAAPRAPRHAPPRAVRAALRPSEQNRSHRRGGIARSSPQWRHSPRSRSRRSLNKSVRPCIACGRNGWRRARRASLRCAACCRNMASPFLAARARP